MKHFKSNYNIMTPARKSEVLKGKQYRNITTGELVTITNVGNPPIFGSDTISYKRTNALFVVTEKQSRVLMDFNKPGYQFAQTYKYVE